MTMNLFRRALKSSGVVRHLNAKIKAYLTERRYRMSVERYNTRRFSESGDIRVAGVIRYSAGERRPRIFLLGTDEHQDRSGLIQALERIGQLTCFTRADGGYGQNDPAAYWVRRDNNTARLLGLVKDLAHRGEAPDMLIAQTWGSLIVPAALSKIRSRYGTFIINISMDDRHQYWGRKVRGEWNGVYPLIPHIDLALTAAPECVDWYRKEGCPALFFPEASDPAIFHPMPELPKIHDVSFVGARYGVREELVLALRRAGIAVTAHGDGWESGRIAPEEVPRLFAQSRIVLGVGTVGHCRDFYALKLRDFDGPMSGSCYLTHDNPDLHALYAIGREIVTYRDIDDCVQQARQLLADDVQREQIAARGRDRAVRDHTWDSRFVGLMARLCVSDRVSIGQATYQSGEEV